MNRSLVAAALALVVLLLVPFSAASGGHYVPKAGDAVGYHETITLTNGVGNYTGYAENAAYDGSIRLAAVAPNGTESATYQSSGTWSNNQGASRPWSESGAFSFSAMTFHYVQGTDNQTGYVNPYVWFYVDNTAGPGASFYVLNTRLTVVSTNFSYASSLATTGAVKTIFAEGNGSYQRADVYGTFTATYNYKGYFDPGTGYIVGYLYTETDSDSAGNGFLWTDTLTDTRTTGFALTPTAPPVPGSIPPPPVPFGTALLVGLLVVVVLGVIIGVAIGVVVARRRRSAGMGRSPLPRHAESGGPALYPPPPPIDLRPGDQPPVQQIVMRETVKVPCRYCGTLIDSTATVCPKCGAPRT